MVISTRTNVVLSVGDLDKKTSESALQKLLQKQTQKNVQEEEQSTKGRTAMAFDVD